MMPSKLVRQQSMTNEEPLSESKPIDKPDYEFKPNEIHEWRQQGFYLICKSCELQHAVFIGSENILVGINKEGKPILKSRRSVFG